MLNRTIRIIRILAFAAYMFVCSMIATGQDVYSVYSRLAPASPTSGNDAQIGIGGDIVIQKGRVFFDVDASFVREPKGYVGDGWTVRSQAEANVRVLPAIWIGGGWSASRHWNSSYAKSQYQPMITAHFRPSMSADFYLTALPPATGNDNDIRGYRLGYRGTLPISADKKWGMFTQVEYTSFTFRDFYQVKHGASSMTIGIGLSRIVK